ncbi:MAG: hypothetical protein GY809_10870 [Planctomycetes bacterium]|nr:hypothetical protein [Planctomycetota bacterium]
MARICMLSLCLAICVVGCKTSKKPTPASSLGVPSSDVEYPEWVLNAAQDSGKDKNALYGVGFVSGVKNRALAFTAAENRAVAKIQRTFQVYIEGMMEDYMQSTLAGEMTSSEEQNIKNTQRTIIDGSLSGVIVTNRWVDPSDNTVYVQVKLDYETFETYLDKMNVINEKVKVYVQNNAKKAFDDLDKVLDKRRGLSQ